MSIKCASFDIVKQRNSAWGWRTKMKNTNLKTISVSFKLGSVFAIPGLLKMC